MTWVERGWSVYVIVCSVYVTACNHMWTAYNGTVAAIALSTTVEVAAPSSTLPQAMTRTYHTVKI